MSERLLESRISALRGQVRRLLVLHGLSWVVASVIPLVILAGLADWLFHLEFVVRLALLVLVAGVGVTVLARHIFRPLFVRFGDLDIALRIEERWPGLHDRLASTIQFLRWNPGDERHGSPALREATIKQAIEETRSIDFRQAIEYRPIIRMGALAAAAAAVALSIGLGAPLTSRLALRRLFVPWGADRWPQATHLALQEQGTTLKIARGDSFTVSVQVRKGDRIPDSAYVTYAFADGEELTEPLRAAEGGEFHGRIDTVNQPLKFSVRGGDDFSSIRDVPVKVVPPPALNHLAIRLVAPKYTGLATQTLAAGLTSFRALEGTKVELDAQANKTLASAVLHMGDQPAAERVSFNPAQTGFHTGFPVKENVVFWFALQDNEGFRNRDSARYDVKMFRDEPPRVLIAEPRTDRDVPADAVIPIHIEVDDDFGLQSSTLMYKIGAGDSEPHSPVAIPLWINPNETPAQIQPVPVKHKELDHVWKLESLKLAVGSLITFYAEARDYDSIKGPNVGKSREIRLRIVSKEDASRQFDDARRELREEIARILTMQRQAITPVDEAARTLEQTGRLPHAQRENLNNAGLIQRQVGNRMTSRDEGLEKKLEQLLDDLRNFKIANPEARQQLEQMRDRVGMLRDRHLEPAEQGLSRANKSLAQLPDPASGAPQGATPARADTPQPDTDRQAGKTGETQGKENQASAKTSPKQESAAAKAADATKGQANPKPAASDSGKNQDGSDRQASRASSGEKSARPSQEQPAAAKPEPTRSPVENARQALAETKTNQKSIADELQKMLDELGEFETYRGVVKDAQNLLKKQEEAMKQSADAATKPDLMSKPADALSPEQKSDLSNLASRQGELAKGLQNLQERLTDLSKRLDPSDPLAASAMRDAAEDSRKRGTSAKMGEAAEQLEKNQMGKARASQEQARQDLKELVDSVQNRRERELSRLVKELKKAENELRDLRKQQAQNLKATREAKQNPNAKERQNQLKKLAKQQAQIQQSLKRQLQRLAKLNAERAGRMASDAEAKMAKAQEGLEQDQGDEAGKKEEEALSDLNDAQEELENVRKEAEERLAMEQIARMGDQLKTLSQRQGKMVTDTENYENLRKKAADKLTIAQRAGVRGLADVQAGIRDETAGLTEQLEGAPVFSLTLKKAAEQMDTAAKRLQALKTDEETLSAVRSASHRFEQLIKSLENDAAKQGGQQAGGGGGGGGGAGGSGGDGIPATAQLKMLRTLQQELNERTEAFDELRRRNKQLTPDQTKEADRLSTDQGALADLVRDLTRPKRDDGEE